MFTRRHMDNQRGFTMVELLITMVIAAFVSAGMFNLYLNYTQSTIRQDQVLAMQQNARVAMDDLERDIRRAGVDVLTGDATIPDQSVFTYAGPYELVFNANLDDTMGAINTALSPSQVPLNPAAGVDAFYAPNQNYPVAETVRWTLDRDDNGLINSADSMAVDPNANVGNPALYRLSRQLFGSSAGSNGPFTSTSAEGIRGPDPYPDGTLPPPLLQYWINEVDFNADGLIDPGEDINGNGLFDTFLWGDDGGTAGLGSALAGNGVLDPPEIVALMTGNGNAPKVLDSTDTLYTATTGDARAIAMSRAQALSNINRVTIHAITETLQPDPDYIGSPHGSGYHYREQSVISSVTPRNAITDVTADMTLTISASPGVVTCPANTSTITVRMADSAGTLTTTPTVVTVTTSMGWFSPSNTPSATVTTNNGVAVFSMVGDNNSSVSTAVINATATVLAKQYSAATNVDFTSATPTSITLTADAASLPADGLSSTVVRAALLDNCGKSAGDGSTVSWAITTNPLGIGGSMNPPISPVAGSIATGVLTAGTSGGLAVISATESSSGISGITTVSFTDCSIQVTPVMPAIPADGLSTTQVGFVLVDNGGTPQPGVSVNITTDAGTVNPTTVITDANGAGTVTLTSDTTPHTAVITVSVPPVGHVCDFTQGRGQVDFSDCGVVLVSDVSEVTPGTPGGMANITATVLDSVTGKLLPNQNLTFTLTGTDGTLAPLTATTNGLGQGTTVYTAGPTPGIAGVGVSTSCGVSSVNVFVRSCLVSVLASPSSISPAFGSTTTVTTTLTDSITGVPLAGRQVTFSVDNLSLADFTTPTTMTTDINGTAVATLRALGATGVVTVMATSACGSSTAQVVLNDWQISLTADTNTVVQGKLANLTATITSGGMVTNPPPGQELVTLTYDSPTLGSTIIPMSANAVGGVTSHQLTAGTTSGLVTIRASATVLGVLISTTDVFTIIDPPSSGSAPLALNINSPNTCGDKNDKVAFTVDNVGLDDVIITSVQFSWTGGGELDKVKTEGQTSDCKGGGSYWKRDGCGKPDGRQKSPATLTAFCKDATIKSGDSYTFNEVKIKNQDMRGQSMTAIITTEPIAGGPASTSTITFTLL